MCTVSTIARYLRRRGDRLQGEISKPGVRLVQLPECEERETARTLKAVDCPVLPSVIYVTGNIPFNLLLCMSLSYGINKRAPRLGGFKWKAKLGRLLPDENRYSCEGKQIRHVSLHPAMSTNTEIPWNRKPNRTTPRLRTKKGMPQAPFL